MRYPCNMDLALLILRGVLVSRHAQLVRREPGHQQWSIPPLCVPSDISILFRAAGLQRSRSACAVLRSWFAACISMMPAPSRSGHNAGPGSWLGLAAYYCTRTSAEYDYARALPRSEGGFRHNCWRQEAACIQANVSPRRRPTPFPPKEGTMSGVRKRLPVERVVGRRPGK